MQKIKLLLRFTIAITIVSVLVGAPQAISGNSDPTSYEKQQTQALQESPCEGVPKGRIIHKLLPSSSAASRINPLANSSFDNFYRYPAEEQFFKAMDRDSNGVAFGYYRDVLLGGQTFFLNAQDGDTQTAEYRFANGLGFTAFATFHSQYNGRQNCFVYSDGSVECGATNSLILWIFESQCTEGRVTANYLINGTSFFMGEFNVRKRIPEGKVPHFPQYGEPTVAGYNWGNEPYGEFGKFTISKKGCAMCALAQLLSYHLQVAGKGLVTPRELNMILRDKKAYDFNSIVWERVPKAIKDTYGVEISYLGPTYRFAPNDICQFGPQLFHLGVGSGNHWLTVHGQDGSGMTPGNYLSNDPGSNLANGGKDRYLSEYAPIGIPIKKMREFVGPEYEVLIRGHIRVAFHSPGEIFITDPQGRRTGINPLTNQTYTEIPFSAHELENIDEHDIPEVTPGNPSSEDDTKLVEITNPIQGQYSVTVTGTGTGTYALDIRGFDEQGQQTTKRFVDVPLSPNVVHKYSFTYALPIVDNAEMEVEGGFDGGGQRPRDVNKFLSYANPTESQTDLPAATTTFGLLVVYNKNVIPATFKADLNGVDITSQFNPVPGTSQMVTIRLQPGSNVLKLSIDGNLSNRVATDTDRLVFKVQ